MCLNCHRYFKVNVYPSHRAMLRFLRHERIYTHSINFLEHLNRYFKFQEASWNVAIQDRTKINFSSCRTVEIF